MPSCATPLDLVLILHRAIRICVQNLTLLGSRAMHSTSRTLHGCPLSPSPARGSSFKPHSIPGRTSPRTRLRRPSDRASIAPPSARPLVERDKLAIVRPADTSRIQGDTVKPAKAAEQSRVDTITAMTQSKVRKTSIWLTFSILFGCTCSLCIAVVVSILYPVPAGSDIDKLPWISGGMSINAAGTVCVRVDRISVEIQYSEKSERRPIPMILRSFGFPFPAIYHKGPDPYTGKNVEAELRRNSPVEWSPSLRVSNTSARFGSPITIPYGINVRGLVLDAIIYAMLPLGFWLLTLMRRRFRIRSSRCGTCAYPRSHQSSNCPECGTVWS